MSVFVFFLTGGHCKILVFQHLNHPYAFLWGISIVGGRFFKIASKIPSLGVHAPSPSYSDTTAVNSQLFKHKFQM